MPCFPPKRNSSCFPEMLAVTLCRFVSTTDLRSPTKRQSKTFRRKSIDIPHGNIIVYLCRFRPFLDVHKPDLLLDNVHESQSLRCSIVVRSFGQTGFDIQVELEFRTWHQPLISIDFLPLSTRGSDRRSIPLLGKFAFCLYDSCSNEILTCALIRVEYSVLDVLSLLLLEINKNWPILHDNV